MLHSTNVVLRRSSDAPLQKLRATYGSEDGAEAQLEVTVLAAERRVKGHSPPLSTSTEETSTDWDALLRLLADVSAYGSLGRMGGADSAFCLRLQPLLTRLMKSILNGGFTVTANSDHGSEEEEKMLDGRFDTEVLLQMATKALVNCSEGVARRCADTTLEVNLPTSSNTPVSEENTGRGARHLQVTFGFADYSSGETGAMLWAGAVGLSLFLIEHSKTLVWQRARAVREKEGRPLRILELGCGPALVSLVLATLLSEEEKERTSLVTMDITDIAETVVTEARRSFESRNGPSLSEMLQKGHATPQTQVHLFELDFSVIPLNLHEAYDLALASDVVYDHTIASYVAPALQLLLRPGGEAILCCEAHRDGMASFIANIRAGHPLAPQLYVMEEERDVQTCLSTLQMPPSLTASTCTLMRIGKRGCVK